MASPSNALVESLQPLTALVPLVSRVAERRRVILEIEGSTDLPIASNHELPLIRLCYALVVRAIKSSAPAGTVRLAADVIPMGQRPDSGRWVQVAVSDAGNGLGRDEFEEAFRDFRPTNIEEEEGALGHTITCRLTGLPGARLSMNAHWGDGCTLAVTVPTH